MGQVGRLGPKVGGHLALLLHSSREPGELSQCSKHDDSTINIDVVIIIIIITVHVACIMAGCLLCNYMNREFATGIN